MGIQNLNKLIQEYAPASVSGVNPSDIEGKRIAVDIAVWLYAFVSKNTNEAGEIEHDGVKRGILFRALALLRAGVTPVFVFDGPPPPCKEETLRKRREQRENAAKRAKECTGDQEQKNKLVCYSVKPTPELIEDVKVSLGQSGFSVVSSPGEAEAQCAYMCRNGDVWAVISEDTDTLTLGAPRVIRGFTSGSLRDNELKMCSLDRVLADMKVDYTEFVDMCILCGCDYTGTLPGVGTKRSYTMIEKWGNIESIIENLTLKEDQGKPRGKRKRESCVVKSVDYSKCDYKMAREMFFNPSIDKEYKQNIEFKKPSVDTVSALCSDTWTFTT